MQHTKRRFGKMQQKTAPFLPYFLQPVKPAKSTPFACGRPVAPIAPPVNSPFTEQAPPGKGLLLFHRCSVKNE
jgi:hypothetical protein